MEVDVPGRGLATGQVAGLVDGDDGRPRAYQWIPDEALLPGHPWHGSTRNSVVSRAADVRPTLLPPASGPHDGLPPTFGTRIAYLADDRRERAGTVVRSRVHDHRLACTVRFDDQPGPPVDVDAADLAVVAGTAWPDRERLVAARTTDPLPPAAGELLVAAGRTTVLTARLTPEMAGPGPAGTDDHPWTAAELDPATAADLTAAVGALEDPHGGPAPPVHSPRQLTPTGTVTVDDPGHGRLTVPVPAF
nr:hypothetical protein [Micromonospora sp. DSM 115978]